MNFKDWWEHNKSEYFYSEEDLAEDAYVAGYSEKQVIMSDLLAERTTELTKCKYKNEAQQAELVSAKARIAELREALVQCSEKLYSNDEVTKKALLRSQ